MSDSGPDPSPAPTDPGYLEELCRLLEEAEPDLWRWFSTADGSAASDSTEVAEAEVTEAEVTEAEVELLRSAYRLDGDLHDLLTADAALLAGQLSLDRPVTLYQALHDGERNARVEILGRGVHIVFAGDLLELLSPAERRAVLAHELAHVQLLDAHDGRYRSLSRLIERLAGEPGAHPALAETARRVRLHTEVHADAVAVRLVDDLDALVAAVVKVSSGLRNVDPRAYLRQAKEILDADEPGSAAWSHPELHVRVACLAAVAEPERGATDAGDGPHALVRSLIDGPDDLDRIDLLGQVRLQRLSWRILSAGRREVGPSGALDAHLAAFRATAGDIAGDVAGDGDEGGRPVAQAPEPARPDDGELASAAPSVRHLAAALLVDLALADDDANGDSDSDTAPRFGRDDAEGGDGSAGHEGPIDDGLGRLRTLALEAERIGVETEFDRILSRATAHTLADVRRLRSGSVGR